MDAQRKLERLLLTLLACCCTVLLVLRFNPSEATNHDAAYRLQAAYFKLWISNKQDLTNALEINDLIPILIRLRNRCPAPPRQDSGGARHLAPEWNGHFSGVAQQKPVLHGHTTIDPDDFPVDQQDLSWDSKSKWKRE